MCIQFYPFLPIAGCLELELSWLRIVGIVGFVQGFHEPHLKHDHLLAPGSEVVVISPPRAQGINTYL